MKYEDPKNVDLDELPEIAVRKKGGFSLVWIIPYGQRIHAAWRYQKSLHLFTGVAFVCCGNGEPRALGEFNP
jgi:hypothetical protein